MEAEFSLLELMETPAFWVDQQMVIRWHNRSAQQTFNYLTDGSDWTEVCNDLPQHYVYRIHDCRINDHPGMLVECIPSSASNLLAEIQTIRQMNRELEAIFEVLDDLFITDGNGITVQINAATEKMYGVQREELIGRSVFDLEKERLFYPSVTAMVLRTKSPATILQRTKDGRQLVVTGYPVFDETGQIFRVIANANNITNFQLSNTSNSDTLLPRPTEDPGFVSDSANMQKTIDLAKRVARSNTSVLLLGETGVGKNRLASLIHQISQRKSGPFVEINCAAIPDTLLESELFGYERGAFTGARREGKPGKVELAEHGTLFLNEIGELPLALQSKLLDLLQDRQISRIGSTRSYTADIRIIAATNQDLDKMVQEGRFREDLYYRLNVFPITIPPLRERQQDILRIAEDWLSRCPSCQDGPARLLHPETVRRLQLYPWPGNIRELENVIERMVITVDDALLLPGYLPEVILRAASADEVTRAIPSAQPLRESLLEFERSAYVQALQTLRTTYEIAKHLGVSQPTVVRKLHQFGLSPH